MKKKIEIPRSLPITLLQFLGVGGLVGGLSFTTEPDGSGLGMSTDLLKHAPMDDYFIAGIFLLIFMSLWPFINLYGLIRNKSWADNSL